MVYRVEVRAFVTVGVFWMSHSAGGEAKKGRPAPQSGTTAPCTNADFGNEDLG